MGRLRMAAASIPAHIVEGNSWYSRKQYIQFLIATRAGFEENRYDGLLAGDLQYAKSSDCDSFEAKAESISRMQKAFL
jgi:four helix bundle protein